MLTPDGTHFPLIPAIHFIRFRYAQTLSPQVEGIQTARSYKNGLI